LNKDDILKINDVEVEKVHVPKWGEVFIKTMDSGQRDKYETEVIQGDDKSDFRAKLAVLVLCDKDGQPLFDYKDYKELSKKSAVSLDHVFRAAIKLNAFTSQDVAELEKN